MRSFDLLVVLHLMIFCSIIIIFVSIDSALCIRTTTTTASTRQLKAPNIIIMFMDDMGWGDLGSYGNPADETPNLDKMAREGIRFTDMYTASAICSPSRASLLTGLLPIRNGFYSTNQLARNSYAPQVVLGGIDHGQVLLPELLAESGLYRNKIVGKWHLGHRDRYLPLKHGFHEWFGAPNCHYKYNTDIQPEIPLYKNDMMTGRYYQDYKIDHETGIGNLTQLYVAEALEFIEKQVKKNNNNNQLINNHNNNNKSSSFFLYFAPDATHTPLYASKLFRGRSKRGLYGDAVMEIDDGIGKIMNLLKKLHIDNDTLVFFSSDNGAATYAFTDGGSNGPFLCGKQTTFEGGFRQPAIARYPGKISRGRITNQVATLMDIMPTILDYAGLNVPKNFTLDGKSIRNVMESKKKFVQPIDRPVFYYRGDTLFKARYGLYKAHFYTWNTPKEAIAIGYRYCPGERIENVTTDEMKNYTKQPLLFHLGRDAGEKFPIDVESVEYKSGLMPILKAVEEHKRKVEKRKAKPQFNICDLAEQNWSPKGCEKIDRCMKAPKSYPYTCFWPY